MATKHTCNCIGDLEERRRELDSAMAIIEELERHKGYWMCQEEGEEAWKPWPGGETRVRVYNEIIKFIIENYG